MAEEESEYESIRRKNLEEFKLEFEKQFGKVEKIPQEEFHISLTPRKSRKYNYAKVKSSLPCRMSLRNNGRRPSLSLDDSENILDKSEYNLKKMAKRRTMPTISLRRIPVPNMKDPHEITESDIQNISYKSAGKKYDTANGTTCHQCRQKTTDTKSICRSSYCNGVRGQFCGFCLLNRYGEDVAEVITKKDWSCPPCRNICNCSICRTRLGKRPTGILAPLVVSKGYSSVKDFLLEKEPLDFEDSYSSSDESDFLGFPPNDDDDDDDDSDFEGF